MNLGDIAILNIKGFNYRCVFTGIIKCKAIKLLQDIDFEHYKTKHQKQF